ncbi:glycosyl transferase family group 2-domain-containing protein [Bisporella sp. PMI_857]|nr:glycosyl transferase family group 2-domain-containing protein [Bisporella sp. PMI_857]
MTAAWLFDKQRENKWSVEDTPPGEGVVVKVQNDEYICLPETLKVDGSSLIEQVAKLNVRNAMTMNTFAITTFLHHTPYDHVALHGETDLQLQLLPSLEYLGSCSKMHYGAFIRNPPLLVTWDDKADQALERARKIEELLIQQVWGTDSLDPEKQAFRSSAPNLEKEDEAVQENEKRPTLIHNPIMISATMVLLLSAIGLGWRQITMQCVVDKTYWRTLLALAIIPQMFLSLFFMQVVVINVCQIFGPTAHVRENSKFFSAKPPPRMNRKQVSLPHITFQMPVYKEGLDFVIEPTIKSIQKAISTYELQGGTASILVSEDGLNLIPENERKARMEFYEENNIAYVARPAHNPDGSKGMTRYERKGKFKKASNMNYTLNFSNRIEDELALVDRWKDWTQADEDKAYKQVFDKAVSELHEEAVVHGNVRIGDYILLIDSDTRVPEDCLMDASSEMELYPEVGIMQFTSGVMQVSDSYFEKGVTFFTNMIYLAIRFTVANGDSAPFVGHNAILRWSALQEVSFYEDDMEKFWSESHVSEDFDMSLRLQCAGYIIRLASYFGEGFKEGVSLTVYDELNRWEKYAYGCNELLFHPLKYWLTRGPFTPIFKKFVFSTMRLSSKISIMAYIGTYYAIGAAWILTILNFILVGFWNVLLDHYYLDSFKVYFSLVFVFSGLGNIALPFVRYRLHEANLFYALYGNFKWLILMSIFLGGLSIHVSQALLCHFFSIDMSWGATAKEVENVGFGEALLRVFWRFKYSFLICFACTAAILYCRFCLPWNWLINDFVAIFPLSSVICSHIALPIVLNPQLMMFSF